MFEVVVESGFSAAHRLREYEGACERLHGHNYRVEAVVRGSELGPSGMLVDFRVLKKALGSLMERLDHRCLNDDIPEFALGSLNPTAENIAKWVADGLAELLPADVKLGGVTVWESEKCSATYAPE